MIYHIYWGTSGNSGLYLDEIYQVLKVKHEQRVFVSYYYPFEYGDKIFFRYTDIAHGQFTGLVRKVLQLIEIIFSFLRILIFAAKDKPQIINYSHAANSYPFILYFLLILKKVSSSKLIITCHDVNPNNIVRGEIKYRQLIFNTADYLLVHNDNSIKDLIESFSIKKDLIIKHPFPIMDISKQDTTKKLFNRSDFLFIGHLRKEKGIQFLLDTWKEFHLKHPKAKLYVCGKKTSEVSFIEEELKSYNIVFHLDYISDEDYYNYIKSARYVILPYLNGTNSGIISTVLSLGANVITSDIQMFKLNSFVSENDMFISNNKQSLLDILERKYFEHTNRSGFDLIQKYRNEFSIAVNEVYDSLINKDVI